MSTLKIDLPLFTVTNVFSGMRTDAFLLSRYTPSGIRLHTGDVALLKREREGTPCAPDFTGISVAAIDECVHLPHKSLCSYGTETVLFFYYSGASYHVTSQNCTWVIVLSGWTLQWPPSLPGAP